MGWGAARTGQTRSQDRGKDMGLEVVPQWGGREDTAPHPALERSKTGLAEFGDEGHPDSREDQGQESRGRGRQQPQAVFWTTGGTKWEGQARRGSGA